MFNIGRVIKIAKRGGFILYEINKSVSMGNDFSVSGDLINQALIDLGPTFVKIGQMLSLRPDIIPSPLANKLRDLLDHGNHVDYKVVSQIFRTELGQNPERYFDFFEKEPFAVASLAQVHKAKLNGRHLAVKVQKPKIKELMEADLRIVKILSKFLFLSSKLRPHKRVIDDTIREFFKWMSVELDYRMEALNMSRIKNNSVKLKFFNAPQVYYHLSSQKILTMDFIDGVSLNEIINECDGIFEKKVVVYKGFRFNRERFVTNAIHIVFKQMFEDGFFHADPHPANIFIGEGGKIALVDFGIVGTLQPNEKEKIFEILKGVIEKDANKVSQAVLQLDEEKGNEGVEALQARVKAVLDEWSTGSVLQMSTAELFYKILTISLEAGIELPRYLVIIGKTLLEYDGVLRRLKPDLDLISAFRPYVEEMYGANALPMNFVPTTVEELLQQVQKLPAELGAYVKKVADEGLEVSLHIGLPKKTK